MNLLLALRRLWIAFVRQTMFLVVRTQVLPREPTQLSIDPAHPVCYALPDASLADLLVLDREAMQLGLPRPTRPLLLGDTTEKHAHFALGNHADPWDAQASPMRIPRLERLVEELAARPELELQIVPVFDPTARIRFSR